MLTEEKHNLFCNNCHSHVAHALNQVKYQKSTNWNMVILALLLFFKGRFVSQNRTVYTYLPFCILLGLFSLITMGIVVF
jgi:transmembrane protein 222